MTDQFMTQTQARATTEPTSRQTAASGPVASSLHRVLNAGAAMTGLKSFARALRGGAGVVQRNPKNRLANGADDNAEVPDLPADWVEKIKEAVTPADRMKLVKKLVTYLAPKLGLPAPSQDGLDVRFVTAARRATAAAAKPKASSASASGSRAIKADKIDKDFAKSGAYGQFTPYGEVNAGGRLQIAESAFDSPALLYSTLRHELIHFEQSRQPSAATTPNSPFMYEDPAVFERNETSPELSNFLGAVQEIETHAWEIINADRTGAAKVTVPISRGRDDDFIQNRLTNLRINLAAAKASFKLLKGGEKKKYVGYQQAADRLGTEAEAAAASRQAKRKRPASTELSETPPAKEQIILARPDVVAAAAATSSSSAAKTSSAPGRLRMSMNRAPKAPQTATAAALSDDDRG